MKMKKNDYLHIAMGDLQTAKKNLAISEYTAATFYSQQCIEKSLKFLLENMKEEMELKTHNLRSLYRRAKIYIPQIESVRNNLNDITDYYFTSRYPGEDYYKPTANDAYDAVTTANQVFNLVYSQVENKEDFPLITNDSQTNLFQ